MAWDALGVSWVGLTTFASGLYHAMGGVKERKECFSQGQIKTKLQMREKIQITRGNRQQLKSNIIND